MVTVINGLRGCHTAKGLVRSEAGNLVCIVQPFSGKDYNKGALEKGWASSLDRAFSKCKVSGKDLD